MRTRLVQIVALATALVGGAALTVGSTAPAAAKAVQRPVSVAMVPGATPQYIFPIVNTANFDEQTYVFMVWLMYRPLYLYGHGLSTALDTADSLAYPPVFSNAGKTVTIRLKPYRWSDGTPVTSRDVAFFLNLIRANKAAWAEYVPGELPDNLVAAAYPTPSTVRLTFNRAYSRQWLTENALGSIIPIPQQAWDRTSAAGPVGNYDQAPGGAKAVFHFLSAAAASPATYATNPLWRVVDGPFTMTSYNATTGYASYKPNPKYSGPSKARIPQLNIVPFTTDAAELNAMRAGTIDYGYLPFEDSSQASYFASHGYRVANWVQGRSSWIQVDFTHPPTAAILSQLYVRQALQRLIDQPAWIRDILHGYASPTYGPVPPVYKGLTNATELHNPYPYSPSKAEALLRAHGWSIKPQGADSCIRPGTGPTECGPKVKAGASMSFEFNYASGIPYVLQEVEAWQSAASRIGIHIVPVAHPSTTIFSLDGNCPTYKPCNWDFGYYYQPGWGYGNYPSGEEIFKCGEYWVGGYCSPTADRLIDNTLTNSSPQAMYRYEDYIEQQLPVLWIPNPGWQISLVRSNLHGALPQSPLYTIFPEKWYWS